ncbi:MAG: aKG-HExxH-type peptide beta-hydroxylase [Nannocystaceae bacterium]
MLPALPDLTIPAPDSKTSRVVLSAAIRRLLGDLSRLPIRLASPVVQQAHRRFIGVFGPLVRTQPGAVASVLRRPNVGGLIRTLRSCPRPGLDVDALVIELHGTLAVALGATGALPQPIHLEAFPQRVVSLTARQEFIRPEGVRKVVVANTGVTYVCANERRTVTFQPDTPSFHSIEGTNIVLATADNNPLSDFEAHPEKQGNQIDLGGQSSARWASVLGDALSCIGRYLPELRAEIELFIHQIIPVGFDAERHLSASYQEAIGTIYMTLHPQPMTMVEAVIHEFSHNKINALFELDGVFDNAYSPLFSSPIRPDPRPLHGILLAVHAFLPVARLYEMMIEQWDDGPVPADLRHRFAQIVRGNHDGTAVLLENAQATQAGSQILEELASWDEHFARHR